jgi:predicted N-acetyltransferase YhbS
VNVSFLRTNELSEAQRFDVTEILEAVFPGESIATTVRECYFSGYQPHDQNIVIGTVDKEVAGVAIIQKRQVRLQGCIFDALTVGPVAVKPCFQGKGFSKYLLTGVDKAARYLNAALIYLVGIKNFYHQFGYFPCLSRSKVSIMLCDIGDDPEISCAKLVDWHKPQMQDAFDQLAAQNSLTSHRGQGDWRWLFEWGIRGVYFYDPVVIENRGKVIGYVTGDIKQEKWIREAVYLADAQSLRGFLAGLKMYGNYRNIDFVEVMTPLDSPLYSYLIHRGKGVFTQLISNNSGQLLKIANWKALSIILTERWNQVNRLKYEEKLSVELVGAEVKIYIYNKGPDELNRSRNPALRFPALYLPGVLAGLYQRKHLFSEPLSDDGDRVIDFFESAKLAPPFIFQGDNL